MNDYASVLSRADRARLESLLEERERATGAQMAIAIFRSLEGESLEDFSDRLAQRWRIGQKGLDNGVILLVFVDDRRVRLEVGYGLEGAIPDVTAGEIIRHTIAPRFREGRYAAGLEAAAGAVYGLVGHGKVPARSPARGGTPGAAAVALLFVMGVIVVLVVVNLRAARRTPAAYTGGRRGWAVPPPIIVPPVGWGGGARGSGGGGFSPGGGGFGGGGASGNW